MEKKNDDSVGNRKKMKKINPAGTINQGE